MATDAPASDFIDITPLPHILFGMGAQSLPWWKSLGELVDNSLDAKATRVVIKCSGRTVSVADDGRGMPDIANAITLGGHKGHGEQSLGRYGVGLKDAWRSAGERIEVVTVRGGVRSYLDFCLASIQLHERTWRLPKPITSECQEKPGTRIVLHLREGKNKPGADAWDVLSWAFTPALLTGRQIVQGNDKTQKPIAPCKFPSLAETICETFEVCGKQVRINIGTLAAGEKIYRGPFWVQYGHRNIVNTGIGIGDYTEESFAGTIVLGEGWKLTKNKDDFDDHKDELHDAIHQRIKPLLEKVSRLTQDVESNAFKSEIAGMLNAAIEKQRKEKRHPAGGGQGTVVPANTGRQRRRAQKIHPDVPGNVTGDAPRRGYGLDYYHDQASGVGYYDYHGNKVKLNLAHPLVEMIRATKNKLAGYTVASAIVSDHHCLHEGASKLLVDTKEFANVFSSVTATIRGDA